MYLGFPDGSVAKNVPASAGDAGDIYSFPGLGRYTRRKERQPLIISLEIIKIWMV